MGIEMSKFLCQTLLNIQHIFLSAVHSQYLFINQAMGVYRTCALALVVAICCTLRLTEGDGITLPDQVSSVVQQQAVQPPANNPFPPAVVVEERNRNGKNLLDFVGLGTGANLDPYHAKTNANCLRGELADCFKSQAIGTFEEFFNKVEYR